jgi:5-hydroxyisourate hydrolase
VSISTHVLDAVTGRPAAGLELTLGRRDDGHWQDLARRVTDAGGRVGDLAATAGPGTYRIVFDTGAYLPADAFYPEVVVVFRVTSPDAHYHVPLLLSPFAYSTYRGS